MIELDGARGEGGGQILRSALTLSVVTGQPMHITNIRAGRRQPGLQAQHLTAVKAAAAISNAHIEGALLSSTELLFMPDDVRRGDYRFDIGTAGSTSLVLQTIFLPLSLAQNSALSHGDWPEGRSQSAADGPALRSAEGACPEPVEGSEVMLIGGTHVPWSPCFHYLDLQWLTYLRRMGFDASLELLLAGFYPQGNGQVRARIAPVGKIAPLSLPERGALRGIQGISAVANLDMTIAERQRDQALRRLKGRHSRIDIELLDLPSRTKGTFLLLLAEFRYTSACYVALGALGKRAEQVADEACLWLERFLAGTGAIDEYLADQILLPLAFADGPSEYRTAKVTPHLITNAEIIQAFTPTHIEIADNMGYPELVRITP